MPFKKHRPEEIIGKLREAEIVLAQGASTAEAPTRNASHRIDQAGDLLAGVDQLAAGR